MRNILLPPGFKDELFEQSSTEHKYKNKIIKIFQKNGYALIKTPLIEYANAYNKNNSFLIKIEKNQKDLTLRNDITMQIARVASSRLVNNQRPLKICYYGEVVRKKGTMLRPERQFLQVGAECIGEMNYLADVEILNLAYESLNSVGIKDITIELSSNVFLDFLLKKNKNKKSEDKIRSFLRKKDLKNTIKYLNNDLINFAKTLLACSGNFHEKKLLLNKLKINKDTKIAVEELTKIFKNFQKINNNVEIILDLTESDYLNYHNGTRFTIFSKNVRGEVARGGRYQTNNGKNIENATGFNCYMDTIIRASTYKESVKKILIPFNTNKLIKNKITKKGFIIETFFEKKINIRKLAKIRNCHSYLLKNKIIKLESF
mgnify:CR=1 FL=1